VEEIMSSLALARTLALFILATGPASAQVVTITQSSAVAGNVTPGDRPGFPVSLTRPGSYRLGSDLEGPTDKNVILVTNAPITIDLNGFSIKGGYNGIQSLSAETLAVRNGTITGAKRVGILAGDSGQGWVIENVRIFHCGTDGINSNQRLMVTGSTIIENDGSGIVAEGGALIEGNLISANGSYGVKLSSGLVLGNMISGNGRFGISAGSAATTGYGNNYLAGNSNFAGGPGQVTGSLIPLQPNACSPACP
jgi:hypothetical protein